MRLAIAAAALLCLAPSLAAADAFRALTQGEARFERWRATAGREKQVTAFERYLESRGVGEVLPTYQLWRTDENWIRCGPAFVTPPRKDWPRIVETLRIVRNDVEPALGELEVVSGYRTPAMNRCVGGASRSAHMRFGAFDFRPRRRLPERHLAKKLCVIHGRIGRRTAMGLGVYGVMRFHIDTVGYRSWGKDYTGKSSPCRGKRRP